MTNNNISHKTLGCRLNFYESSAMKELAVDAGLSDAVIVNTCAVTQEAVRKSCQMVRQVKRSNPNKKVIVTGCAVQIDPEQFNKIEGVDWIIGNSQKLRPNSWQKIANDAPFNQSEHGSILVEDIMEVKEINPHLTKGFNNRAVAYVQVQNGCDHRCTFCIIPFGRGNSRSIPAGVVVSQIRELVASGFKEVVLTGVDITSWGGDLPGTPKLGYLVTAILNNLPELQRLRLSSIDPAEIDDLLFQAFSDNGRLMPHIHLSVQSGNNMILKRMKRRHCREDVITVCQKLRNMRPEIVFGADIIAGFPTESEAMFQDSLALIDDCDLTWLHVFPFSPRQGTPAARMPQNNRKAIRDRAAQLREAGEVKKKEFYKTQINKNETVLIESATTGRTRQYAVVELNKDVSPGQLLNVVITGYNQTRLEGVTVN